MATKEDHLNDRFQAGVGATVGTKIRGLIAVNDDLKTQVNALRADLDAVRTALITHLANGAHTAAANQTAADVTAATPAALTSADVSADVPTDDLNA